MRQLRIEFWYRLRQRLLWLYTWCANHGLERVDTSVPVVSALSSLAYRRMKRAERM